MTPMQPMMRYPARLLAALCLFTVSPATVPAAPAPETSTESPAWIVDKPIAFSAWRQEATLDYIREHYDPAAADIRIRPSIVVVHWTAIPTFQKSWDYFNVEKANPARKALYDAGRVNVGIHFMVDPAGKVYRLMPETWMARHCVGINRHSIGIENVGGPRQPLTDAQLAANAALIRYLVRRHKIRYLIGHSEYLKFKGTPYWEERDPNYRSTKIDPGDDFLRGLRARLKDLRLEVAPVREK